MLNKLIADLLPVIPENMVWVFSKRYIAGETIDDALFVSKNLNRQKMEVTVDLLGEFIQTSEEARINKNLYFEIIERFLAEGIQGSFSVKPTMFGLLIDPDLCYCYLNELVSLAAENNTFIRIDMEDSRCVDSEIELFQKLHKDFPANVGLVFQSYLRRTRNDLEALREQIPESVPLNLRLCKGIYVEPEKLAFKKFDEIRAHFLEDLEFMFSNQIYSAIATHDKFLIEQAYYLIDKYELPQNMYEFQMLYGVTPELRQSIIDQGHRMRVYVPFGKKWFNYSTRRLKENPKIAQHIIKALFVRG